MTRVVYGNIYVTEEYETYAEARRYLEALYKDAKFTTELKGDVHLTFAFADDGKQVLAMTIEVPYEDEALCTFELTDSDEAWLEAHEPTKVLKTYVDTAAPELVISRREHDVLIETQGEERNGDPYKMDGQPSDDWIVETYRDMTLYE